MLVIRTKILKKKMGIKFVAPCKQVKFSLNCKMPCVQKFFLIGQIFKSQFIFRQMELIDHTINSIINLSN